MNLPRNVSEVVAEHVTFEVECIDRMFLNVYVPGLQYPAGLVGYVALHNRGCSGGGRVGRWVGVEVFR